VIGGGAIPAVALQILIALSPALIPCFWTSYIPRSLTEPSSAPTKTAAIPELYSKASPRSQLALSPPPATSPVKPSNEQPESAGGGWSRTPAPPPPPPAAPPHPNHTALLLLSRCPASTGTRRPPLRMGLPVKPWHRTGERPYFPSRDPPSDAHPVRVTRPCKPARGAPFYRRGADMLISRSVSTRAGIPCPDDGCRDRRNTVSR